ncbi:MAG: plasmid partitioning protein RepB C-terminal domain-containing protein [Defluviicoccus sp.]
MSNRVRCAFENETRVLPLALILPTRQVTPELRNSHKYQTIRTSVREVGIVEPLVVHPQPGGTYALLDGHLRLDVLKELGASEAHCLIATEDEGYTYNKRINRLSMIQEHNMIRQAIERGLAPERIARALNVNVASIREKQHLLRGIAPEVAELLKDRHTGVAVFQTLRKMKPLRQMEVAELMTAANRFTVTYARALLAATPREQLADPGKPKVIRGINAETLARMEREMEHLQRDYRLVEDGYGSAMLNLVIAKGYVSRMLANEEVQRYLDRHHRELSEELRNVIASVARESSP